jgi:hypothetical protein
MISLQKRQEVILLDAMGLKGKGLTDICGLRHDMVRTILNNYTRILVLADSHCGHKAGLTPPGWQREDHQEVVWDWYSDLVKKLKADVLFFMGDACDGKGKRSGGSELLEVTWKGQCDMATEVIEETGCKTITMVYGTGYHVGNDDDHEDQVAQNVGAIIKDHAFPTCNGIQFDLKHKVAGSTIPHGRSTPLQKAKLWNAMWNDHDKGQPLADVILRGHVHYHEFTGNSTGLAMTCPALQSWGSKYGQRQCEGIVDTGLLWFDIRPGDTVATLKWHSVFPQFSHHQVRTYEV